MKIGLVAMSGIRCRDNELLELGLTLPGFVERSKVIAALPSLGLLTLAGMTPKEYKVDYTEIPDIKELDSLPLQWDLVGISSYCAQIDEAYELARQYKAVGVPVVLGGPHVSHMPDEAAKYCDSVVIGEGEVTWLEVLRDCGKGKLKRQYGSVENSFDLKNAPMPAFELLDISKYNRLTVQTSRGCTHLCEFCGSSPLITKRYSQKPVDKVIAEIDKIKNLWEGRFIEFVDDNAVVDKKYWRELLTKLKTRRIRWFAETDLSVSEDDALLDLMRASGCAQVLIGLESPVEAGLDGLELRSNWKYKQLPKYRQAIRKIQSHGIRVTGCFIFGLDGQTPDIFDTVWKFAKETELFDVQMTFMTPFAGTPVYDRLSNEKRLLEERDWQKCTLFDVMFKPTDMSVDELRNGFRKLGVAIYGEEATLLRRETFKKYLRGAIRKETETS
ncbi:MAG: B12-binding domain-containing radical SAM protein [candidate division WOR-3 bacterium]|nr:B12-binding domain-containing radical SAM protein [candidate division WOR-3 bacterium]